MILPRQPERRYDHVVFDLDGTLVDSRADLAAAVNHVLRSFDLDALPFDTVCNYIGEGARRLVQRSLGPQNEALLDEAVGRFLDHYGRHLLDRTKPYAGIPEALSDLRRRGVTLSVLTNKPEAMSRAILEGLDLLQNFIAVIGGDSLPVRKPAPAGIEHLCHLAEIPVSRLLLVGDSAVDVQTARAANVAFCGVTWGIKPDELRAAGVSPLLGHPRELGSVILAARKAES